MTREQHFDKILAKLDTLIAGAKLRTPGRWKAWENVVNGEYSSSRIRANTHRNMASVISSHSDATFIASCAGNAEAGWMSTRKAIEGLEEMDKSTHLYKYIADSIIAAWPEEVL